MPDAISSHAVPAVPVIDFRTEPAPSARIDQRREETLHAFADQLRFTEGRVLLAAESAGRRELLLELLRPYAITAKVVGTWREFLDSDARIALTVAPLASGVTLREPAVTIYAEEQLFGERARQERRRRRTDRDPAKIIQQLADLRPGAPVVHEDYGVGRYTGLTTMDAGGMTAEFLVLEYAEGDKLYVPVQALERISRYTGAPAESAPLHKLGGEQWSKARARAAAKIRDAAAELLDVYARRAAREGHAFPVDDQQVRAFESGFPFEETVDQLSAIRAVIEDLRSGKPMDRVVCGDVGFGKTEVALRAAFVAVQGGKQVAVLVPTTLLAQQHFETFADRFADWPVKIELLSRFRAGAQSKVALDGLASGKVDIVVGTHRLLQPGVKFKDLGLVIIDEEHRFGVRDKERLKSLRAEVDVLTLTATPIPRTLNMALGGLRDLSLITTPPAARLSIKTFVAEWNGPTVREACLRELRRGGQVYFVHNSVETIEKTAQQLAELVPEARIVIGHGQMRERDLEQVMLDFYHQRANLLLCTTIIESGIDVPTANTIIIDRADRFGLAQLHQLRGRVGRSHHQAYAYLIAPPKNAMTADAARGSRRSNRWRTSARASCSPRTTSKSAAPANCSAKARAARSRRSASRSTWNCSSARWRRCRPARHRSSRSRCTTGRRSTCTCRRCCPRATCRTCTRDSCSTSASRRCSRSPNSTTCRPRRWIASGRCPTRRRTSSASRDCAWWPIRWSSSAWTWALPAVRSRSATRRRSTRARSSCCCRRATGRCASTVRRRSA